MRVRLNSEKTEENDRLPVVATRKNSNSNNHLEEAMALLIRNQAASVEQIARNDQERLKLQRSSDESQRETKERLLADVSELYAQLVDSVTVQTTARSAKELPNQEITSR